MVTRQTETTALAFDILWDVGDVVSRHVQFDQRLEILNLRRQALDLIVAEAQLTQSI